METPRDNANGIPVVVSGIPTVKDENGIVSPFPYLNPDSEEWKGADDEDGFDDGGIGVRPIDPEEPDNDGGDEEEFEDDDNDDTDTGFGIGIGLLSFVSFQLLLTA